MSNIKQETIFVDSGLDHDSDERYIAVGDSVFNLNILVSEEGAIGTVSNAKGNSLAIDISEHILSLSDSYTTLGSYYNRLTRKVYYLVFSNTYDSGGGVYIYDNKLFCFDEDKETLDLIFTDTANYFGLDPNYPLRDMDMLGDWLYFTPRVSEPKMIDVVMAYNYTNYEDYDSTETYVYGQTRKYRGGVFVANQAIGAGDRPDITPQKWDKVGSSYKEDTDLAMDSEFNYAFNVIKMPPPYRPTVSYGSDTYIKVNNLRGRVFRFSYRYKYFDNTYSVYSSFSDVTLPEDDELYNGEILNTATTNNYITVGFYLHSPALVKEVEIVVQETGGDWRRVSVFNRQNQDSVIGELSRTIKFYNNESYVIVDNVTVAKIEDSVPLKANSQAIINKNILSYGGCLEGHDNIPKNEISVLLTPVAFSLSTGIVIGDIRRDNLLSGDIEVETGPHGEGGNVYIDIGSWWPNTVIATDVYTITADGITGQYTVTAGDVADKVVAINHLIDFLNSLLVYNVSHDISDANRIQIAPKPLIPISVNITQSVFASDDGAQAELNKYKGFKDGANHPFCIFYYDGNMRRWDAQTSYNSIYSGSGYGMNGTTVYVPMINEISPVPVTNAYRWVIDWEVYHLPPAGAKYWRWGYAGNSLCSYMVQYIVTDVTNASQDQVKVDITPLQTLKTNTDAAWNVFPMSVIDAYEWQKGDRIRFITEESVAGAGTDIGAPVDGVYDFEIIRQDNTDNSLYLQGQLSTLGLDTAGVGVNSLVEIYTPLKALTDTKKIYYEFGDLMNIIEDSAGVMVHEGQASLHNQSSVTYAPAMGTFDGGDIYHIVRTPSKPLDTTTKSKGAFHESMWYSDFYESQDWDKGKIGFETAFGQRFLNIVRYSNQYLQDTMINGLSTFEGDSLKTLNDIYGDIVAIYEQGDTLKVYQERKASSILIGRTEYMDAQGNTSVAISERVLGAIRYSPSNYSTIFPESVSRNNKFIYGFDIYNGVVWRDSVNGLFPISGRYAEAGGEADYKMMSYFKQKAKDLMRSGVDHVSVLTVWDEEYKMLYVTFKDYADSTNNETVAFHEPSNRWVSFYSFGQTPVLGWITPLRLDYNVVLGFPNGIGHTFNDATGFDEFDFATPVTPEDTGTYIVDEDDVTYITDEDGETFIIE